MQGVTPLMCWGAIPLPVKTLLGGQPADRCAEEVGRGDLPAAPRWPAGPWLLPPSCQFPQEPAALLAGAPGGQTSDGGKWVCVLFCRGEVSEPRTYLANEVVITPSSLIG